MNIAYIYLNIYIYIYIIKIIPTEIIWLSRSDAIRTVQFKDCVTDKANEIDNPARPKQTSQHIKTNFI